MTQFYGITPMDVEHMTFREVSEYLAQMAEHQRAEEEAMRRGR